MSFKQTGDYNGIVRSNSDPLGKPGSVDRGNSPGQGFVTHSSDDRCVTTWMGSSVQWELCKRGVHILGHLNGGADLQSRGDCRSGSGVCTLG